MTYRVSTIRSAGLDARWTRTMAGAPIIAARIPNDLKGTWFVIDARLWSRMEKEGIRKAFELHTALGAFFSIPA